MRFVLFCQNPYAFGILEPIMEVLKQKNHSYCWFLTKNLLEKFPFPNESFTTKIQDLKNYNPDAILCPGNEVPHFLPGLKVQIFHGLAGEKKGHFHIRHYFDLYLTQGPYFTKKFLELKQKYKNFDVIETGWSKLDIYAENRKTFQVEKERLLQEHEASQLILYAPTFSPSLTSAPYLLKEIKNLAEDPQYLVLVKFHDLMDSAVKEKYQKLAETIPNLQVEEEPNILKFLLMADLMISDTSSVVYEFLLLNKPVITFKSSSKSILWDNTTGLKDFTDKVKRNLEEDPYKQQRLEIIKNYHPHNDGKSSLRVIDAIENYIAENGVPEKRKLPLMRRWKMNKMFK